MGIADCLATPHNKLQGHSQLTWSNKVARNTRCWVGHLTTVAATFSTCTNSSVATAAPSDPLTLRAGENEDACPDPLRRRARGGAASGWDAAAFPLLRCGALAIIPGCLDSPLSYRAKRGCG